MIHEVSAYAVSERVRQMLELLAKYSPNQPRVPAGSSAGGQWTSGGGGIANLNATGADTRTEWKKYPDAIEPVYPLETLLGTICFGRAISAVRELTVLWAAGRRAMDEIGSSEAAKAIEEYFGGKPDRTFSNKDGDVVMMGSGKKVRFDIKNSGNKKDGTPDEPHFHI